MLKIHGNSKSVQKGYLGQLNHLLRRFERTTNFNQGRVCFQDDVNNLDHVKQQLLNVGLSNICTVDYSDSKRDKKRQRKQ